MLRIILTALLMVNAIFWGIYPPGDNSPHSFLIQLLKINYKPTKLFHILIGLIFYLLGTLVAHQKSIKHLWF